ncbi:hypothetical protein Xtri_07130 [Xanthomonas campestris pv. trichodesmae]|uniref:Uncharacterized protein n=3 Tax=Xanthomonas citri TaxID=346 RepID=A0AB33CEM6_XANCI|nr:hypothetical protein TP45_16570 [Xanthomonas citri pv. aurantifolii]ASK91321.1 hypothetical protein XcvCFBP7111P_07250 [Xanthomonas citri pv. vignicola]MBZ3919028.1 hypothetical protein [Xanthomonas campestris pv. trichodesmae]
MGRSSEQVAGTAGDTVQMRLPSGVSRCAGAGDGSGQADATQAGVAKRDVQVGYRRVTHQPVTRHVAVGVSETARRRWYGLGR